MGGLRAWALGWSGALAFVAAVAAMEPPSEFAPWTDSGFADAEHRALAVSEIYPRSRPEWPRQLDATVLFARGTPWTQARAIRQVRRTAAILATCGIAFGTVRLVRLRLAPNQRRIEASAIDPETGVPGVVAELSKQLPSGSDYPAAFLLGGVNGGESLAVSYRAPSGEDPKAPYFDTAWIGYQAHWIPRSDDRYSPLAHEFAHLLCRCGHTRTAERHLLHSARNFLSADVLPEHCARFQDSSLISVND